jgi:hypothetical protein
MYRSKYLAKMQQGGAPSVFAPDPRPYRAPLQGLNPQVFQYDVSTQPLDNTNLIQVMQTKDANDIKREAAVLERQKLTAEKELKEQELEFKRADMMLDFYAKTMKMTGGMKPGPNGTLINDEISNSPRNQKNLEIQAQMVEIQAKMEDLLLVPDKTAIQKMLAYKRQLETLQQTMVTPFAQTLERASRKKFDDIAQGNEKDMVVNPILGAEYLDKTTRYYAGEDVPGYKEGVTPSEYANKGMFVNMAQYKKDYEKVFNDANKTVDVDSVTNPQVGLVTLERIETRKVGLDKKAAAKQMAQVIASNASLLSGYSIENNINPYNKTPDEVIAMIAAIEEPKIGMDDALIEQSREIKSKELFEIEQKKVSEVIHSSTIPPKNPNTRHEIVVSGGTTKKETRKTDVNYSGQTPLNTAPAKGGGTTADSKVWEEAQKDANTINTYSSVKGAKGDPYRDFLAELKNRDIDLRSDPIALAVVKELGSSATIDIVPAVIKRIEEKKKAVMLEEQRRINEKRATPGGLMEDREYPRRGGANSTTTTTTTTTTKPGGGKTTETKTTKKTALEILKEKREQQNKK